MVSRDHQPTVSIEATGAEERIEHVAVLGGGSAGFLAALTLKTRLPQLKVTVVHSSKIPIIGVGEGSTFTMPIFLHGYLGIDPALFHQEVRPTYKLGIRFLWGPRPRFHYAFTTQLDGHRPNLPKGNGFYCFEDYDFADLTGALMGHERGFMRQNDGGPLVDTSMAYHLENVPFVEFLEKRAREIGVVIVDAFLDEVTPVDGTSHRSMRNKKGHLVLAGHSDRVEFRPAGHRARCGFAGGRGIHRDLATRR